MANGLCFIARRPCELFKRPVCGSITTVSDIPSALDRVNLENHWLLVNVLPNPCCHAATSEHPKHPRQQP